MTDDNDGIMLFGPETNEGSPKCFFYLDGEKVGDKYYSRHITYLSTVYYAKFVSWQGTSVTVEFSITGGEDVGGGTETEQYTYDYGVELESVTDSGYTSGENNLVLSVYAISKTGGWHRER